MSREEESNIIVEEVRGKKRVGFQGTKYIETPESEMRELVEDHGDAIIALYEVEEEYDSPGREWHYGRVIDEYVEDDLSGLTQLWQYSTLEVAQRYDLKLYRNFYQLFPNEGYDSDYPWALYSGMVKDKRLDESREVFDRLQATLDDDERPRTYEYRAYLNCDSYGVIQAVQTLHEIGESQTGNLTTERLVEGVKRIRIMAGEDPSVATPERVEAVRDELDLTGGNP
jgi:hypothetical protein